MQQFAISLGALPTPRLFERGNARLKLAASDTALESHKKATVASRILWISSFLN
ncbi:hypothetical protein H6G00_00385 [Leptolyngbya sp. FACHB-541]|uniref:hypothetical protein n=1 Tax=Leptolyngbya sp. FACHB-541 TaxID=2692810 RepID=UPI001686672F|nr:hypothetical protein [Leptolyngbya sp. FACHB-541]MBD1995086.1 hypothetical protein [Leptolyngbya sp. FACHB-541]